MTSITTLDVLPLVEPEKKEKYTLNSLADDTDLHRQITADFKEAGLDIERVECLKNFNSWNKYNNKKNETLDRVPQAEGFKLNETYLYHGTGADKDRLCEEGFDVNLASDGCFGKGIYFSDTPKKCIKYSKNGIILLGRVILGETKVYEVGVKAQELVREPEKKTPYKGWRFYDSVKGRPRNCMEYVVYRSELVLIEAIITFSKVKTDSDTPSPVPQTTDTKPEAESGTETGVVGDSNSKTEDYSSSSDDDDDDDKFEDGIDDVYSSSSSDEDGNNYESLSDSDDDDKETVKPEVKEAWTVQSVIPYFTIPKGELTLEQKKAEYTRVTQEEKDEEVNSMLTKTDEDLERAIFLFYAYKQVREEEAKGLTGEYLDQIEDDGSPIFPLMDPEFESETWKNLSENEKEMKMSQMVNDFLTFTTLEESQRQIASNYVSNAKYNLDTAVFSYYKF